MTTGTLVSCERALKNYLTTGAHGTRESLFYYLDTYPWCRWEILDKYLDQKHVGHDDTGFWKRYFSLLRKLDLKIPKRRQMDIIEIALRKLRNLKVISHYSDKSGYNLIQMFENLCKTEIRTGSRFRHILMDADYRCVLWLDTKEIKDPYSISGDTWAEKFCCLHCDDQCKRLNRRSEFLEETLAWILPHYCNDWFAPQNLDRESHWVYLLPAHHWSIYLAEHNDVSLVLSGLCYQGRLDVVSEMGPLVLQTMIAIEKISEMSIPILFWCLDYARDNNYELQPESLGMNAEMRYSGRLSKTPNQDLALWKKLSIFFPSLFQRAHQTFTAWILAHEESCKLDIDSDWILIAELGYRAFLTPQSFLGFLNYRRTIGRRHQETHPIIANTSEAYLITRREINLCGKSIHHRNDGAPINDVWLGFSNHPEIIAQCWQICQTDEMSFLKMHFGPKEWLLLIKVLHGCGNYEFLVKFCWQYQPILERLAREHYASCAHYLREICHRMMDLRTLKFLIRIGFPNLLPELWDYDSEFSKSLRRYRSDLMFEMIHYGHWQDENFWNNLDNMIFFSSSSFETAYEICLEAMERPDVPLDKSHRIVQNLVRIFPQITCSQIAVCLLQSQGIETVSDQVDLINSGFDYPKCMLLRKEGILIWINFPDLLNCHRLDDMVQVTGSVQDAEVILEYATKKYFLANPRGKALRD